MHGAPRHRLGANPPVALLGGAPLVVARGVPARHGRQRRAPPRLLGPICASNPRITVRSLEFESLMFGEKLAEKLVVGRPIPPC